MGVNSAGYLVLLQIVQDCSAFMLVTLHVLGITSGLGIALLQECLSRTSSWECRLILKPMTSFTLLLRPAYSLYYDSVSAYHGYHTEGGALDVARSSTKAVVYSAVIIMISNLVLTQILL